MSETDQKKTALIRDELRLVLASEEFARSRRLRALLRHLVEKTLAGESDRLKGFAIGLDVFERGEDFNPDIDTIVRVHAVRLRAALSRYYMTKGANDPLVITIPKGRYVPEFSQGNTASRVSPRERKKQYLWWAYGLAAILVLALCAAIAVANSRPDLVADLFGFAKSQKTRAEILPTGPSIIVMKFKDISKDRHSSFAKGVTILITSDLTRFGDLFVYAPDTAFGVENLQTAWNKYQARYVLTGTIQDDKKKFNLTVQLIEMPGRTYIWSKSFNLPLTTKNIIETRIRIASAVAAALGQPYGIINIIETRNMRRNKKVSISGYGCYLRFFDYARHENSKTHLEVRDCLEKAVSETPDFADGWAALSWILADEYRQDFNPRPQLAPALERAIKAARKAVALAPNSAFARRRLAAIYMITGKAALAKIEIKKALKFNPNDADVLAAMGWNLKSLGEWDSAMSFAKKAIALNPVYPQWYLETPFLYYYRKHDCTKAMELSSQYYQMNPDTLLPHIFAISISSICGRRSEIAGHIDYIKSNFPDFLKNPQKSLQAQAIPEDEIKHFITNLKNAGLKFQEFTN